ncbi:MAG: hypothetical protein AAF960_12900 [Bacteroidota bacterium]
MNIRKIQLLLTYFLIGSWCFLLSTLGAQNSAYLIGKGTSKLVKLEEAAKNAYEQQDYYSAYKFYEDALRLDDQRLDNRFQMARAAEQYGAFCAAGTVYERVVEQDTANLFGTAKQKLAEMEMYRGNYSRADSILFDLETAGEVEAPKLVVKNIAFVDSVRMADMANRDIYPANLGPSVNTPFAEISPVWRNGRLYYGSLAFAKKRDKVRLDNNRKVNLRREYAKTMTNNLQGESQPWDSINVTEKTVTHLSFTPSDDRMYFTICDYQDNNFNLICEIYYKDKIGIGPDDWGPATKLPESINTSGLTSTQPSVGLDENGEAVLYFVSDRPSPEAMGGFDIWASKINDGNIFGTPVNLGPTINTSKDDITPFYHYPSNTFYFSSEGRAGYGGHDIYQSKLKQDGRWGTVKNLLEPLNSSANDFDFFLKEDGERAFLVSNREGCDPEADIEAGCFDIYTAEMPECETKVLAYLFDQETGEPLTQGNIAINEPKRVMLASKVEGNQFLFNEDVLLGEQTVVGSKKGYETQTVPTNIEECEINELNVYLPPIAQLEILVFARQGGAEIPLPNALVELTNIPLNTSETVDNSNSSTNGSSSTTGIVLPDAAKPISDMDINDGTAIVSSMVPLQNQIGNQFNYRVRLRNQYQAVASHPGYTAETINFVVNSLATRKVIYLVPNLIPDTIACFFHHDIPKRKVRGVEDPSTDVTYDETYFDYRTKQSLYERKFSAGERGAVAAQSRAEVRDFFAEKIDSSFVQLNRFKDNLLANLELLSEGEIYIVNIKGYASSVGDADYNLELAQRRINSVKNYFTQTHGDVFGKYLFEKKNLVFEELPVGEPESGFDRLGDVKNNVYSPISAAQRRVEIISLPSSVEQNEPTSRE